MRISSQQIFNIANNSMADANEAILHTQRQLSTGQRVLEPSDDPVASTKILSINEELATINQYRNNINIARNDLVVEEAVLDGVLNIIQRVQELAVQAGNTATLSESEYLSLSNEVDARLDELQSLLNTQNANGDYIFGGYKSLNEPFSGSIETGFRYNGDDGQKRIKIANNTFVAASDSGKAAFVDVESARPNINTYASQSNRSEPPVEISIGTIVDRDAFDEFFPEDMVITFNEDTNITPAGKNFTITERSTGRVVLADQRYSEGVEVTANGVTFTLTGNPASATAGQSGDRLFIDSTGKQDILTTMARFTQVMRNYDRSPESRETLESTIADTLDNLKNAQTSVLEITSEIGARFNTLDSTQELHFDADVVLQELRSELRDIDYAEASTRLSSQTLILQAAQTAFVRVTSLSLFNQL
jgi:flagellar hook-associated protein 3 FlgL